MFTGIIKTTGEVRRRVSDAGGMRLTVRAPELTLRRGDSVAVDGVCLTVTSVRRGGTHPRASTRCGVRSRRSASVFVTDVSPETLRVTTLGELTAGALVNLEQPLRAADQIGGHFVQGHVDGVGRIEAVVDEGSFQRVTISFPAGLAPYLVLKGAIAVDGISLTVAALGSATLDVQIVPYTREVTNLRQARPGKAVNLECDLLGKYVVRLRELAAGAAMDPARGI